MSILWLCTGKILEKSDRPILRWPVAYKSKPPPPRGEPLGLREFFFLLCLESQLYGKFRVRKTFGFRDIDEKPSVPSVSEKENIKNIKIQNKTKKQKERKDGGCYMSLFTT